MTRPSIEYTSGITKKSLVIGLIASVFIVVTQYARGSAIIATPAHYDWWFMGFQPLLSMATVFTFMLLFAFINYGANVGWWRIRFSRQEASIIAILMFSSMFGTNQGNYQWFWRELFREGLWTALQPLDKQPAYWSAFPTNGVLGPLTPEAYAQLTVAARTLFTNYAPFIPMITAGILWYLTLILALVFGSLLLRRLYIEIEYLPMPISSITSDVIELVERTSSKTLFLPRSFLVSFLPLFIIYFVLYDLPLIHTLITGAPSTLPWTDIKFEPAWDLTRYAILPWSGLAISLMPFEIGWSMLLPISLLLTVVITWFALYVIFPFIYSARYWPPTTPGSVVNISQLIYASQFWAYDAQGFSRPAILAGMVIGLAIAPLILHWNHIAPILKSIIREPSKEFDPLKPVSYRTAFMLTILFFILWLVVATILYQIQFIPALVFIIIASLLCFGSGRLLAETGGFYGQLEPGITWMSMSWPGIPGAIAMKWFADIKPNISSYMTMYMLNYAPGTTVNMGDRPVGNTLISYHIGRQTATESRGILLVIIAGVIISVVGTVFVHFFNEAWSLKLPKLRGGYINTIVQNCERGIFHAFYSQFTGHPIQMLAQIVIGFAVILVLAFLATRIGFLRGLSIGGIVLGTMVGFWIWAPFLVGFIVKYIVLRVGGVKMYEEKLKPIALGILLGHIIPIFINNTIGWINWLIYG
jgi:hypothetical protein